MAATLSPPPIIDFPEDSATAFAICFVPTAKASNSNTPAGPFQKIVLLFLITSSDFFEVSGPQSRPCQVGGISLTLTVLWFASALKSSATSTSTGNIKFTPLSFAFLIISSALSYQSGSQIDLPTS